eukprot:CAMPEP_0202704642 /NCGR_PEP_ID=MMETSP1385-20130828/17301_1 /ASSEMBLY_ACC=CAM_ASM_000861 /TAXON_ID=933848 /ORGANISM="Elphidium margaritaceum" /LENGTH=208 /DNA_ID=CAMNT_0049362721 /DNA_START=496 /DNA_END=1122 /DNA_ORIENTATION=-
MDFLYAPPAGFSASVDLLNVLNIDSLQTIAYESCVSAFEKRTVVPPSKTEIDVSFSDDQIASLCNALCFLYNGCLRSKQDKKTLYEALRQHTDLEDNVNMAIAKVYSRICKLQMAHLDDAKRSEDGNDMNQAKSILSLGRLVSMKWSMGMTISSSRMKKVQKPFVRLQLTIAHCDGEIKTYFVTLSILQFQELRQEIKLSRMVMADLD